MVKIGVPAPSAAEIWAYGTRTLTGFTGKPRTDLVGSDSAIWTHPTRTLTRFTGTPRIDLVGSNNTIWFHPTRRLTDSTNLEDLVYTTRDVNIYPGAAYPPSFQSPTTAWAWGSWVELVPANTITSDFIVLGLVITFPIGMVVRRFLIQLGYGAAGAETPAISLAGHWQTNGAVQVPISQFYPLPIPRKFAANTRLSVRATDDDPTAGLYEARLVYMLLPL